MAAPVAHAKNIPQEFYQSYLKFNKYPFCLVSGAIYGFTSLRVSRDTYRGRHASLFVHDPDKIAIPVRDVVENGDAMPQNILDEVDLKKWLSDRSTPDPLDPKNIVGEIATEVDPRCRFVFLVNEMETAPLELSPSFLSRILTYHQVMPSFLDFLYVYGSPHGEDPEVRYSSFRTEMVLVDPEPGNQIPDLGRSGRRYQMCYNIKRVALKNSEKKDQLHKRWKIRQAAVHHQLDVGNRGTQLWIFGDPHAALTDRISDQFPDYNNHLDKFKDMKSSFRTSLEIHLTTCRWAGEEWRDYIQWLEEIIATLTRHLLFIGDNSKIHFELGAVGDIQQYEDKVNELVMVLEANVSVMTSIRQFYTSIVGDDDFPNQSGEKASCAKFVKRFSAQIDELVYDAKMQIERGKALGKTVADRKSILIQQLQAQTATRQEQFTATMWRQAERSEGEAVVMRIITVITLFYLPPTFSSTLFSTDIVHYGGSSCSTSSAIGDSATVAEEDVSWLALYRWLQLSLPLMTLTILVAVGLGWWESRKRKRRYRGLQQKYPDVFARMEEIRKL